MCFRVWGENRNRNWKYPLCSDVTTTCKECSLCIRSLEWVQTGCQGLFHTKMKSLAVIPLVGMERMSYNRETQRLRWVIPAVEVWVLPTFLMRVHVPHGLPPVIQKQQDGERQSQCLCYSSNLLLL